MTISLFTSRPTRKTTHLRLLTPGKWILIIGNNSFDF
jgi:hypothetical protein